VQLQQFRRQLLRRHLSATENAGVKDQHRPPLLLHRHHHFRPRFPAGVQKRPAGATRHGVRSQHAGFMATPVPAAPLKASTHAVLMPVNPAPGEKWTPVRKTEYPPAVVDGQRHAETPLKAFQSSLDIRDRLLRSNSSQIFHKMSFKAILYKYKAKSFLVKPEGFR